MRNDPRLPGSGRSPRGRRPVPIDTLTPREREIVDMLIEESATNAELAETFNISEETVKKHMLNIMEKTGTYTRMELVVRILNNRMKAMVEGAIAHQLKPYVQRIGELEKQNAQLQARVRMYERIAGQALASEMRAVAS